MRKRLGVVFAALLVACSSEVSTTGSGAGGAGTGGAGSGATGTGGGHDACSVEACAAELGEPAVCAGPDGGCTPLLSHACPAFIGDDNSDDTMWLGFVAPFSDGLELIGDTLANGVRLQNEELVAAVGGIATGAGPRPLNILLCDSQPNPAPAMSHLHDVVRVPAIIGPALSSVVLEVAPTAIASGTMLLSPSSTSPTVTELADAGLVWRTAASDSGLHRGLAGLVAELETRIRSEQGIGAGTPIRVAIVRSNAPTSQRTYEDLALIAVINGTSLAENGGDVITVDIEEPQTSPDYALAIATLVGFEPHLVVGLGFFGEVVDPIALGLEAALDGAAPRPYYALTEPAFDAAREASNDAALRRRLTGVSQAWRGPSWDTFVVRYATRFGGPPALPFAANAYDAAMLLSYALAATGAPTTGADLAAQMANMVTGPTVEGQPSGIAPGMASMVSGSPFDYDGASGPLDFDLLTGDVEAWIDAWCFAAAGVDTRTGYYDPAAHAVTGQLGCP